jgi:hypothetical protein
MMCAVCANGSQSMRREARAGRTLLRRMGEDFTPGRGASRDRYEEAGRVSQLEI